MCKDYSIDADFKSRHRQHQTRRQVLCHHPNYINKHRKKHHVIPCHRDGDIPFGSGTKYFKWSYRFTQAGHLRSYSKGIARRGNNLKSHARLATTSIKGQKYLNNFIDSDGRYFRGYDHNGVPIKRSKWF